MVGVGQKVQMLPPPQNPREKRLLKKILLFILVILNIDKHVVQERKENMYTNIIVLNTLNIKYEYKNFCTLEITI